MYVPKTNRRKGIRQVNIGGGAPKLSGLIKAVPFPKTPQINANMMPKPPKLPKLKKYGY